MVATGYGRFSFCAKNTDECCAGRAAGRVDVGAQYQAQTSARFATAQTPAVLSLNWHRQHAHACTQALTPVPAPAQPLLTPHDMTAKPHWAIGVGLAAALAA